MLKRIDELGRIVIPKTYREETDIKINEDVEILRDGSNIIIKKIDCMQSKEAIEEAYRTLQLEKDKNSEYDRGFEDALKFVLGKDR